MTSLGLGINGARPGQAARSELLPARNRSSCRFQPPTRLLRMNYGCTSMTSYDVTPNARFYRTKGPGHEMQQAGVCHRLPPLRSASAAEYWNTQCARRRFCLSHLRGRSDSKTAMHKHLSCTLSRLSSSEPVAKVRVSGCLPGLHPIHLYWLRTWMTDVPFGANGGGQACHT